MGDEIRKETKWNDDVWLVWINELNFLYVDTIYNRITRFHTIFKLYVIRFYLQK